MYYITAVLHGACISLLHLLYPHTVHTPCICSITGIDVVHHRAYTTLHLVDSGSEGTTLVVSHHLRSVLLAARAAVTLLGCTLYSYITPSYLNMHTHTNRVVVARTLH